MRIFFGHTSNASFVVRDLAILRSKHVVCARDIRHHNPMRMLRDIFGIARCDAAFFWFASIHALPCAVAAKLFGRRIAVVVGGYEAANVPEISYGQARFPIRRMLTRAILLAADLVLAVSKSSQREIVGNLKMDERRVTLLYHGFEDMAGGIIPERKPVVINVGGVNEETWRKKGIADFIVAAEAMPQTKFVHVGPVEVDCENMIGRPLPRNLTMIGRVPYERLKDHLADAKVYVQLSRHESFGCSVAEAMLFGCIPVVTDAFALPEVVGDCGIVVESHDTSQVVGAIEKALQLPATEGERCRSRILSRFSYEQRATRLCELIERLQR